MEKVVFDNFFHSTNFVEKVEKVVKSNFFREQNISSEIHRNGGKSCQKQLFPRKIVEKVVFDNFFHFFHEFLRKSLES